MILANSNPATIMTDPEFADATYVEPLDVEVLDAIIERERPDAVLPDARRPDRAQPGHGAGRARACSTRHGVELIGANAEAIATAEDRERFKEAMRRSAWRCRRRASPTRWTRPIEVVERDRPAGHHPARLHPRRQGHRHRRRRRRSSARIAAARPRRQPDLARSSSSSRSPGWKEYELEVMRDRADNCVVVCSIENLDPMGVHTGDSITVAPAQTLSDVEYQAMRDAAFACIRRVGVETGGSNVQFAARPRQRRHGHHRDEPAGQPRRRALASKATGFPIAKIAARLAVGYTLDEIPNDITRKTPASFEPTIDYVVTKVPRWAFEKFPGTAGVLGTQMQSVGEAMAIGRTFPESLQKALRSLEHGRLGLNCDPAEAGLDGLDRRRAACAAAAIATPDRPFQLEAALRRGITVERRRRRDQGRPVVPRPDRSMIVEERGPPRPRSASPAWTGATGAGPSGSASPTPSWPGCGASTRPTVRAARLAAGVRATFKTVDTCGAEFEAETPYHYSTYEDERRGRARATGRKVVILGSGPEPHRPGHRVRLLLRPRQLRPARRRLRDGHGQLQPRDGVDRLRHVATASTSSRSPTRTCSTSSRPSRRIGRRCAGVIVALGGQTPLKLAGVAARGPRARHQSPASIDLAEDRERWNALCARLEIPQPAGGTAVTVDEALAIVERDRLPGAGAPELRARRPGHGDRLRRRRPARGRWPSWPASARSGREGGLSAERPVLVDRFLEDATEVDVDAIRDAHRRGADRRGDGARRGGRRALRRLAPARSRRYSLSAETIARDRGPHPAHRRGARRRAA